MNPTIDDLCQNLEIGWNLCLGFEGSDCETTYVVAPNDTIESIAEKYSTNSSTVLANNPQLEDDSSNLYIGQVCDFPFAYPQGGEPGEARGVVLAS